MELLDIFKEIVFVQWLFNTAAIVIWVRIESRFTRIETILNAKIKWIE